MTDEFFAQNPQATERRRNGGKGLLWAALAVFLIGAAAIAAAVWSGKLDVDFGRTPNPQLASKVQPAAALPTPSAAPGRAASPATDAAVAAGADARIAALEARVAAIDLREAAASGNSARAEGLLIAFAARRALDRGVALGYLEDQLRLRFADSQPNAVSTVIAAAQKPVTLDHLLGGLGALGKSSAMSSDRGLWAQLGSEVSSLFVIRRDNSTLADPDARIDRARVLVQAGKVDEAMNEVRSLPGSSDWVASARHYADARRALDLIETTALIGTRELKDSAGKQVDQPSPALPPSPRTIL